MTMPSNAPEGRFRSGVVVSSTPEDELRELLADGERLQQRFDELIASAVDDGDAARILRLATIARGAADPNRVQSTQRLAATLLHSMAQAHPRGNVAAWTLALDHALQVLVPQLELTPQEPELLYLLGVVVHELGDASLARRVLQAIHTMDPQHEPTRLALARLDTAPAAPVAIDAARLAPSLARLRGSIRGIIEQAVRLEDRTISLCMIVRDEEEMLPACLEAVAPFVDQIVIVDTGSVDRTREIAVEHGALVTEYPWNGSFSDARNESLRHATGDWILWLDADERLVVEDGPRLRELARRTWVEGFHVLESHILSDDGSDVAVHAPMRMFRRRPQHEWHGTIHEQVAWSLPGWLPGRVQHTSVRIDHYGYAADVVVDREKATRNLQMLLAQHEQEPSAFTSFNIGTEHAGSGDWTSALSWFEDSLARSRSESPDAWTAQPWSPLLVQRTSMARRLTGDHDGAVELVEEGLAAWPAYTDLVFERARVHLDAGEWTLAAEQARRALELGDAPAHFVAISGKGSFQARHLLASALRSLGDADGARSQLEATIHEAPQYVVALADLVDLRISDQEDPQLIDASIDELLGERASTPSVNHVVGSRYHVAGCIEQAEQRFQRVLVDVPHHAITLLELADIRIVQSRMEEAWQLAMQIDEHDRLAGAAAVSAFRAAAAAGRADLIDAPAMRIAHSSTLPMAERSVFVAWQQLIDPDAALHVIVPTDAVARRTLLDNLELLARMHATDAFELLHALTERVIPDEYERGIAMAQLYLRLSFADMAGEQLLDLAGRFGPDAAILTGLGKVATIKQLWDDAAVFLGESLQLDPGQAEASRLLAALQERGHG
jgi:tetratricopeptide (TPR) repeat protein